MAQDRTCGLSPLADLSLQNTPGLLVPMRKLTWSTDSSKTPQRGAVSPRMKMKLSARSSLLRRLNSAPSPTMLALSESVGKENAYVIPRSPVKLKSALEDQDGSSQDSACVSDTNDLSFTSPSSIPSKRNDFKNSRCNQDLESPQSSKRSYSVLSPHSQPKKSLSFCSTDSLDDGFSDLAEDLDKPNENSSGVFEKLLTGQLISDREEKTEESTTPVARPSLRRAFSMVENKLTDSRVADGSLSFKRPKELVAPVIKRKKSGTLAEAPRPKLQRSVSEIPPAILPSTLSSYYGRSDLIADFSRPYALPVVKSSRHPDLPTISPETLSSLIRGEFNDVVKSYTIIDCRYPYEYEAGHIKGSVNLYTQNMIEDYFLRGSKPPAQSDSGNSDGHNIVIFHCEYSVLRGPSLYRWLRREDRNTSNYPSLQYPEVYLLNGGYSSFYSSHPPHCDPPGYRSMFDPNFANELSKYGDSNGSFSNNRSTLKRLARF